MQRQGTVFGDTKNVLQMLQLLYWRWHSTKPCSSLLAKCSTRFTPIHYLMHKQIKLLVTSYSRKPNYDHCYYYYYYSRFSEDYSSVGCYNTLQYSKTPQLCLMRLTDDPVSVQLKISFVNTRQRKNRRSSVVSFIMSFIKSCWKTNYQSAKCTRSNALN